MAFDTSYNLEAAHLPGILCCFPLTHNAPVTQLFPFLSCDKLFSPQSPRVPPELCLLHSAPRRSSGSFLPFRSQVRSLQPVEIDDRLSLSCLIFLPHCLHIPVLCFLHSSDSSKINMFEISMFSGFLVSCLSSTLASMQLEWSLYMSCSPLHPQPQEIVPGIQ